jgi:preprotein translocase subunit SecG
MLTLLAVVHVVIAIALVLFVLLQDPKGGAMGVFSGGGSSNSFFGSSGATNFLTKTTRWLAILFAVSCLVLTYQTAHKGGSVMDSVVPTAPLAPAPDAGLPGGQPATDAAPAAGAAAPGAPAPAPADAPKQ